ncbi:DUF4330 domain-containing protein [Tissierella creatinini]|nr:DUF4330 domain-containing protein [Tissierella creatinini]TJX67409.1 DUF4330 domain-containing protein [Soehngenia saccharolytica]
MKIINEKGKLFGIINIIDLSVLLILALLIIGGASRLKSRPIVASETTPATIVFEVSDIRIETVEGIKEGDPIYHYDKGGYIGIIEDVEYSPYQEPVEVDGKWVNMDVPEKYDATFKVAADVKNNPDVIIAGDEQIRIGVEFRVKNKSIAFFARVMGVELE